MAIPYRMKPPVHPTDRFRCLLCGRDKLLRPGEPHKCVNGNYRKRFKAEARRQGLDNAFVRVV